jgi:hypothetical protein
MPAGLLHEIIASLAFEMFQFAYPFVEGGFGNDFTDHLQTAFFLKTHGLPRMNAQPFPNLFGNSDLPFGCYLCGYHNSPLMTQNDPVEHHEAFKFSLAPHQKMRVIKCKELLSLL